jgi:uncharacterized phage protein gp47/JayE
MSDSVYDYITNTGVIVPQTTTLEQDVIDEWQGALGTGLNPAQSTAQGTLIAAETAARAGVLGNNAQLANQFNPNQAEGVFLDAICALTGLEREANTFTIVPNVVLAGVQGSPIGAGSQASVGGNTFALQTGVTLDPVSGQATGTFVATVAGPIPAPAGAWSIVTTVLGWETVTNPAAPVLLGSAQQPDEALRALRAKTLSLQNVALREAQTSALYALPGVIGVQSVENYTGSPLIDNGITVPAHSMWFCVDGGGSLDIATAIFDNKSSGCGWYGQITVDVTDPNSGQVYPVNYDVPTVVPLVCQVTASQGTYAGDINAAIIQAVVDFSNNDIANLQGFMVGMNASPFEIAAGVNNEVAGVYIRSVKISLASSITYQPAEIAMLIYQKPQIVSGNVSVVIV